MNKTDLIAKIKKIIRANTIEVQVESGQFGQTRPEKQIENISELENDIIELVEKEFKVGKIKPDDIFHGGKKIGASYPITDAVEVAKKWGLRYVSFNGRIADTKTGEWTDDNTDEVLGMEEN